MFKIQVHPKPTVFSLHPALGPEEGDIVLTVKGSKLAPENCSQSIKCNGLMVKVGNQACPVEGII